MTPDSRVACIGGAHIDVTARASEGLLHFGTSNPVTMPRLRSHGGVARNVAEALARLAVPVAQIGLVGADADGGAVADALRLLGIDTTGLAVTDAARTASYIAVLDDRGELVMGLADMAIYDGMTPAHIAAARPVLAAAGVWFLDTNPPASVLQALLEGKPPGTFVAANGVSVAKVRRLAGVLGRIDLLFVNADEASELADLPIRAPLDITAAAARLRTRGCGTVVITQGAEGVFVSAPEGDGFLPAIPARVVDVTGSGDLLAAGMLYALRRGDTVLAAARFGVAAAGLSAECRTSVPPDLTAAAIEVRVAEVGA